MFKDLFRYANLKVIMVPQLVWWPVGRKISPHLYKKTLIIPKGLFFRILVVKSSYTGRIIGKFISTRKPFVRPVKQSRR